MLLILIKLIKYVTMQLITLLETLLILTFMIIENNVLVTKGCAMMFNIY